jgi:hypothetical protein
MASGLKNLQAASRSCSRRERLEVVGGSGMLPVLHDPHGAYGDPDSGIELEGLEAEYGSADTGSYGQSSLSPEDESRRGGIGAYPGVVGNRGVMGYGDGVGGYGQQQQQQMMHSRNGSGQERGYVVQGQTQQYAYQQRLPSIDMGIGAIINRPNGHQGL